jgi:AcrR family transcriptional regulator
VSHREHAPDATTTQILDAAFAELSEFGLRRTTIEDVTRRAKVGRMTLYRRFASKEELFRAVVLREVAAALAGAEQALRAAATLEDGVVEMLVAGLELIRGNPLFARLVTSDPEAVLPYLTFDAGSTLVAASEFVAALFAERVPADYARHLGENAVRIAHSIILTPTDRSEAELREFARTITHALLLGAPG